MSVKSQLSGVRIRGGAAITGAEAAAATAPTDAFPISPSFVVRHWGGQGSALAKRPLGGVRTVRVRGSPWRILNVFLAQLYGAHTAWHGAIMDEGVSVTAQAARALMCCAFPLSWWAAWRGWTVGGQQRTVLDAESPRFESRIHLCAWACDPSDNHVADVYGTITAAHSIARVVNNFGLRCTATARV